jgi:hypothetical protein
MLVHRAVLYYSEVKHIPAPFSVFPPSVVKIHTLRGLKGVTGFTLGEWGMPGNV